MVNRSTQLTATLKSGLVFLTIMKMKMTLLMESESANEEHEEDHGEVSEEGDIDISDNEKFLDENGMEIEWRYYCRWIENYLERHWQKIEKSLDLWANLDD